MRLLAFAPWGTQTVNFPIATKGRVETPPVIFTRAAPDSIAIAYMTTDNILMAHDLGTDHC